MFLHSTLYLFVGWLVYAGKVVGTVVHFGDLVLGREAVSYTHLTLPTNREV